MPKVTVITNNPKYSNVRYGIDLSIPSLYCGAKYCRSGSKSDFQRLKLSLEKETTCLPGPFGMLGKLH